MPTSGASFCRTSGATRATELGEVAHEGAMSFLDAPLEAVYEAPGLTAFDLPDELARDYGGPFGIGESRLFANFVSSLDGITAIPSVPRSNTLVSGGSQSDRFVMGLLRASADVVVIGSATLAAAPRSLWTPEQVFPPAANAFAELRNRIGRPPALELAILTATGRVDPAHPAFEAGALAFTTDRAASRLREELPPRATVVSLGPGPKLDIATAIEALHERGHKAILSEGGPHVFGSLLRARLVDELFLTISPLLVGRSAGEARLGLVEGVALLPGGPVGCRLLGLRRDNTHQFLRYELDRGAASPHPLIEAE
jgi:riboflavin biosynthesis pyrimidine reductase